MVFAQIFVYSFLVVSINIDFYKKIIHYVKTGLKGSFR